MCMERYKPDSYGNALYDACHACDGSVGVFLKNRHCHLCVCDMSDRNYGASVDF